MNQVKFYIDVYHDFERAYRIQEDGTYRDLNGEYGISSRDFITTNSGLIRNLIVIDSTVEINGKTMPLNPTSGTLGEVDRLHTRVFVQRQVKPDLPSSEQLKNVIENGDDTRSNILVLNVYGEFELREMHGMDYRDPTVILRYESFIAGNGYIGSYAANDEIFMHSLYSTALEEWRDHLRSGKVNHYRDDFSHKNIDDLKTEIEAIVIS